MRSSRIVKSMSSTSSHWMPNLYGFYRKAEDVEVIIIIIIYRTFIALMLEFRALYSYMNKKDKLKYGFMV